MFADHARAISLRLKQTGRNLAPGQPATASSGDFRELLDRELCVAASPLEVSRLVSEQPLPAGSRVLSHTTLLELLSIQAQFAPYVYGLIELDPCTEQLLRTQRQYRYTQYQK